MKRFLIWAVIIIGLAGATWGMAKLASSPSGQPPIQASAVSDSDWVKGNRDAKLVLIEYSDFQCPTCAAYAPILDQLAAEFGGQIAIIYRHFPLPQHKNAYPAAYAAEAAGRQDKFWEMADLLFQNQGDWENLSNPQSTFEGYAQKLGVDLEKFKSDRTSQEVKNKVTNDYSSGVRSNLSYTPTFFLNGERTNNPRNYGDFRTLLTKTLEQNP